MILFLFLALIHTSQYFYTKALYTDYREVVLLPEGNELSEAQKQSLENWDEYLQNARATPEQIAFPPAA